MCGGYDNGVFPLSSASLNDRGICNFAYKFKNGDFELLLAFKKIKMEI